MPPLTDNGCGPDLLGSWIARADRKAAWSLRHHESSASAGIRFAFYGRMSTGRF